MEMANQKVNINSFLICVTFFIILILMSVNILYGWSGTGPSLESQYKNADAIFEGKVIKIHYNLIDKIKRKQEPRITVIFDVYQSWKGINSNKAILHTVYNRYTKYGYHFQEGKEYIVFAYKKTNKLDVNVYDVYSNTDERVKKVLGEPLKKFK